MDIRHFVILECRHLANGCVLKCGCIGLMLFRNLSYLGTILCYINTIGIVPAYACNVCDVMQPLPNVHETKWMPHVKRDSDVAVHNSCACTMSQYKFLTRKFRNGERNLHCGVVHITSKWVSSLTLDCNGVFAIKAYATTCFVHMNSSSRACDVCLPFVRSQLTKINYTQSMEVYVK